VAWRTRGGERYGAFAPPGAPDPRNGAASAGLVMVLGLLAAWTAYQPVRSAHAADEAQDRASLGQLIAAASIAQIAHERNPLAVDPLFQLAAIEIAQNQIPQARTSLEQAVDLEPANPETWRQLGRLRLDQLNDPKGALRAFQYAYFLDPQSAQSISDVVVAARAVGG
jgi:tetratricopeptide (TPR) repeat protein